MKDKEWQKVQEIFNTAIALDGRARSDYLKSVETNMRELYGEVISLLSADDLSNVLPNSRADFDFFTSRDPSLTDTEDINIYSTNQDFSLVGETIGNRYHIVKRLGSGGMGDVYLAHDRNVMNRETVVKLLKSETLANKEVVRKFKQEIEALARLKDPGIVTILDSGTYGKQPFLVLEYVEGEDLALVISPFLFSVRDFVAPQQLAEHLREQNLPLALYFWQKLTPAGRTLLQTESADGEIAKILRDEFTLLLSDPHLFDPNIFDDLEIGALIKDSENREDASGLSKANRLLIENAFPGEIIRGGDKKLTSEEAALIFRQLGVSLSHGHSRGIIHRDLKPSNIMITRDGRGEWQTKLIDFGVAKVKESLVAPTTEIGVSFGTRKYMSPEQINGKAGLTPATDVYALGLIAFESLTGQHVFRTDSFIEQCRMQETEEFSEITEFRPDLSPKVKEIICRALSFDPENRQQSAADFGNALADALLSRRDEPAKTEPFLPIKKKLTEAETDVLENRGEVEIKDTGKDEPRRKNKKILPVAVGTLALLSLLGFGIWLIWSGASNKQTAVTNTDTAAPETVKRELNYKLIVQKYYEGKPFQQPFEATGDEIFGDDWRFKMQMSSPQGGNLYLLSENPKTNNLTMLFPHPQKSEGKSEVKADEKIETGEMRFDKNQGTEKFWIVWTEKPVVELEAVKNYVNPQDLGRIKDAEKEKAVRDFLDKAATEGKLTETTSNDKRSKKLITTGDVLVKMAEFRHN